jgi:hypothetical protein
MTADHLREKIKQAHDAGFAIYAAALLELYQRLFK